MKLAFIGCGNISIDHLKGLAELKKSGRNPFELVAVCDIQSERAEAFASETTRLLGNNPSVYTNYREMLEKEEIDAVSVLLSHDLHHTVAEDCFAAGVHVQMQKPLAISPSFGKKMIVDAKKYQRVLTVAEPIVLGAEAVAVARAVKDGFIGPVHLVVDYAATTEVAERGFFGGTPWRHMKGNAGAGWINDHGVHHAHLFTEVNGSIKEIFAYTDIFEKELSDGKVTIQPTGEDTAVTVFRFENGGLGHWMCTSAAHGEGTNGTWFYGGKGCVRHGEYVSLDGGNIVTMKELIKRYAADIEDNPFAHSYIELKEAIIDGITPISSAEKGLEALSVVFAALESAEIHQPVKIQEIIDGIKHTYEDTVIKEMEEMKAQA
ncbi:Gfo/Idh/MocA family protein [Aquibacillus salsiterrae]|uniref:Gfo/Idh/MocA family oxidoreductase n=1 Tax=Aquibacillus salsiterrae TaxID=2950439 RepID=A0A9X3WJU5_9BACI|nr:Gfo/Idh/MocA family oxidoreductase [Aquibacillus salsiterrae]MDC3418396.1 Gfo/Idh/MocA family oxidoreductase [Aquibacillus salsiterrae]